MNLTELLEQINIDTSDQAERQRRIAESLDALRTGKTVTCTIGDRTVTIEPGNFDDSLEYWVTERYTVLAGQQKSEV